MKKEVIKKEVIKKIILTMLYSVTIILNFVFLQAAPLKNIPITLMQPDGTTLKCFASGDESFNYLHDEDGYMIIQDANTGYYVYTAYTGETFMPTPYIANKISKTNKLSSLKSAKVANKNNTKFNQTTIKKSMASFNAEEQVNRIPTVGIMNNVVIFIRFAGEEEFVISDNQFEERFNDKTTGANSLYNYYREVSYNQLSINSYFYPQNENGKFSYTASQPRGYYSPYNALTNTIGYIDSTQGDNRLHTLLSNAVNYINNLNQVPTSLDIDRNDDGEVDEVTFIVSGEATVWADILWPHQGYLAYGSNASINDKKVYTYNLQLDDIMTNTQGGVGVLAHELFHCMGAPDLYRYYDEGVPVGPWDIMEDNAAIPQHMTMYMKYQYGKWIENLPEITASGEYSLSPVSSSSNNVYKIKSPNANEYYVLEYRDAQGVFEASLPSDGLLISRVNTAIKDGNRNGIDREAAPRDEVYIYRANASDEQQDIDKAPLNINNGRISILPTEMVTSENVVGNVKISNVSIEKGKVNFKVEMTELMPSFSLPNNTKFYGQATVKINHSNTNAQIFYTMDGTEPTNVSNPYTLGQEIVIKKTARLRAVAYIDGIASLKNDVTYTKVNTVESNHPYQEYIDDYWLIQIPEANSIKLTFDPQTYIDETYDLSGDYDILRIFGENNEAIADSPFVAEALAGKTIEVSGNQILLNLKSNSDVSGWGFKINSIVPGISEQFEGAIDTPINSQIVKGILEIKGWYIHKSGLQKVEVLLDGVRLGDAARYNRLQFDTLFPSYNTTNAGFLYTLNTKNITNGIHTLTVRAIALNGSISQRVINIEVSNISQYIGVIDTPVDSQVLRGLAIISGWYANTEGIADIEVLINSSPLGYATRYERVGLAEVLPSFNTQKAGYVYYLNTMNLVNGVYNLTISAKGIDGTINEKNIDIIIANGNQYLGHIETPTNQASIKDVITISGWYASTEGINSIEMLLNGAKLGEAIRYHRPGLESVIPEYNTEDAGFAFYLNTKNISDGTSTITVKALGNDGTKDEKSVTVEVLNNAITYLGNIETPVSDSVTKDVILVSGWYVNTRNISSVDILINNAHLGTAVRYERPGLQEALPGYNAKNGGFAFYINTKNLVNGTYTLTAKAIGEDGSVHSMDTRIIISNTNLYIGRENQLLEDRTVEEKVSAIEKPEITEGSSPIIEVPEVTEEELPVIEEPEVTEEKSSTIDENRVQQTLDILSK